MQLDFKTLISDEAPRFAVAVSGGSDSMALALLGVEFAKHTGGQMVALHVDHGLRNESGHEAELTKQRLADVGIPCTILHWQHTGVATAIQERARNARYELMTRWCAAHNIPYLCTGHQAQDQQETIAFRLWRGAGVEGLAGIRPLRFREVDGARIILVRPLLGCTKEALQSYLREKHVEWVEDASNHNLAFDRIKIRKMLRENPGLGPQLTAFGSHMACAADILEQDLQNFWAAHVESKPHEFRVNLQAFDSLRADEKTRLIFRMINVLAPQSEPSRYYQIQALINGLPNPASLRGVRVECSDSYMLIYR